MAKAAPLDRVDSLIEAAKRKRRRGDTRAALQILRQACLVDEWRSRSFALLGAWLAHAGLVDEARERFRHAQWLHGRAAQPGRERAIGMLLSRLDRAA